MPCLSAMANLELCRIESLTEDPLAASLNPFTERSLIVCASPVRNIQRGSLRIFDAYRLNAAGVSRRGSTLMETKRTAASRSIFEGIRRIVEVMIGHVPALLGEKKS